MAERIAPDWFVRDIKKIDDSLSVEWSDRHERWFIMQLYVTDGRLHNILCVMDDDKNYMDLDIRTIKRLRRMFKVDSDTLDTIDYVEQQNEKYEKDNERVMKDRLDDITSYHWNEINGAKVIGMGETLGSLNLTKEIKDGTAFGKVEEICQ